MNKAIANLIPLLMRGVTPAAAITFALTPAPALSAPGDLDPSFGNLGVVGPIMDFSGPAWSAQALDSDGILIGGGSLENTCHPDACYYHPTWIATNFMSELTSSGAVDPGFIPAHVADTQVFDVAVMPGGGVIAVGQSIASNQSILTVFQLTRSGALDASFATEGVCVPAPNLIPFGRATSVVLDPDGRIVIAGDCNMSQPFVLRLLANGVLDESFAAAGIFLASSSAQASWNVTERIMRTATGGYRLSTPDCRIIGLTPDGQLDQSFGTEGIATIQTQYQSFCGAAALQADGRVLVAGFDAEITAGHSFVSRLLANGAADPSFATNTVAGSMQDVTALAVSAHGSVIAAGTRSGGLSGAIVMRLQANGLLDGLFGHGGSTIVDLPSLQGAHPSIDDMYERPDGGIVAAGGASGHPFLVRLVGPGFASGPGVIGFAQSSVTTMEQEKEAIVKVQRTGGSAGTVSVAYKTVAADTTPATAGQDYTPVSGRLTWGDGDISDQEIHVPILADHVTEGDEYFGVRLSDPQGGAGLATLNAAVDIQTDASAEFDLGLSSSAVTEGGTVEVQVTRNLNSSGAVSVTVTPIAGTASAGSDFAAEPQAVFFADGEAGTKTVTIAIPDDPVQEPDETFAVKLNYPTGGALIGPNSTATVTIAASDQPAPVGEQPAPAGGGSGGGGSFGFISLLLLTAAGLRRKQSQWWERFPHAKC